VPVAEEGCHSPEDQVDGGLVPRLALAGFGRAIDSCRDRRAWGALIRSSCKSTGFGTRLNLCTPRKFPPTELC
jgi:hypothetical protein